MATRFFSVDGFLPVTPGELAVLPVRERQTLRNGDAAVVSLSAGANIPPARGPRRLDVCYFSPAPLSKRAMDVLTDSLILSLIAAGLLLDESPSAVEVGHVATRMGEKRTGIVLSDLGQEPDANAGCQASNGPTPLVRSAALQMAG